MRQKVSYNIVKRVRVKDSPFNIAIYIHKDQNSILIEDLKTGKSVVTSSYNVHNFLKIDNVESEWVRSFDNTYVRYCKNRPEFFMPHYPESNRFANLTININKEIRPEFTVKLAKHPDPKLGLINQINNEALTDQELFKTYNYLYKNIKDFETNNFKIEMIEVERYPEAYDENFIPIKTPKIECRLPLFQIYSILEPDIDVWDGHIKFGYRQSMTIIKINETFCRFPYGNITDNDLMCISPVYKKNIQAESIRDAAYINLITTEFNGDYTPFIKFDNTIQTSLDINWIREKISKDDFNMSFIDVLFYLSQCETVEEINVKLFILTPNVPKEILDFENSVNRILNPARAEKETVPTFEEVHVHATEDDDLPPGGTNVNDPAVINVPIIHPPIRLDQVVEHLVADGLLPNHPINPNDLIAGNEYRAGNPNVIMEENESRFASISQHDREILNQLATNLETRRPVDFDQLATNLELRRNPNHNDLTGLQGQTNTGEQDDDIPR